MCLMQHRAMTQCYSSELNWKHRIKVISLCLFSLIECLLSLQAEDSDVITLSGLDVITKWRFPENLSKCPVSNCSLPFDARSDAIAHYRVSHAENNILCSICDEPIPVPVSKKQLVAHYEKVHSTGTKNVGVVERWKTSRRMPCPLKDCTFRTKRKHKLRKHWTETHGDLRFPEVRHRSGYGYSINDRTEQTDVSECNKCGKLFYCLHKNVNSCMNWFDLVYRNSQPNKWIWIQMRVYCSQWVHLQIQAINLEANSMLDIR